MFALKIKRLSLIPLALVLASPYVLTACQLDQSGNSDSTSSNLSQSTFEDRNQTIRKFLNLTDSKRTLSDTKRKLADDSAPSPGVRRGLRDGRRRLKDDYRKLADSGEMAPESLGTREAINVSDAPTKSKLRILPSPRVDAKAWISGIQAKVSSSSRLLTDDSSTTTAPGVANFPETTSLGHSANTPTSGIPSAISSQGESILATAFADPQERNLSDSTVENRNQTLRKFLNLTESKRTVADSQRAFVNPDAFRVSPEKLSSNPAPVQRQFHNASTTNPVWRNPTQEDDLAPLTELEFDSNTRSLGDLDDATTRNLADSDDDIDLEQLKRQSGFNDDDDGGANLPPIGDVHQALGYDPMSRAFTSNTIGDPYLASRGIAPDYRADATQKVKTWRSPNLKHRPLYFEDAALERHGQSLPKAQPFVSGARFFVSVLLLPQKFLTSPPRECVYPVGHGRPGNCTPKVRETLPRRGQ